MTQRLPRRRSLLRPLVLLIALACLATLAGAQERDALRAGFAEPPQDARPMTWWHWMNGNVTRAGITADLEAMKRVGIGGAIIFHVGELPIRGDVAFESDEWWDLMRFAADEADRLGLSLGAHNCPGWSTSGGPWVTVEQSMQKLVWSETPVKGPTQLDAVLPRPELDGRWNHYVDVAVLAVPFGSEPTNTEQAIDLSDGLSGDGRLAWDAPAGEWLLYRFGHTTTGKTNHPAPDGAWGLEADKLDRDAVEAFFRAYPQKLIDNAGPHAGAAFDMIEIDSYEAGPQNWSPRFREEFAGRRGYDPVPWLPVLAGRAIGGDELAGRFRHDMDRTIAELYAENYYGHFRDLLHATPGMRYVVEPYGGPFDSVTVGGTADLVMGEFWHEPAGWYAVGLPRSAAHMYGQPVVSAEAFTGQPHHARWANDPFDLKSSADKAFSLGVNLMVLHTYAHQPWPKEMAPGATMGWWGTHFGRTQTWWEQSGPFFDYLARCQFMLQQGLPVADVARLGTDEPAGAYKVDGFSEDVLLGRMSVGDDGRIMLPDGMSYRVLVFPDDARHMTPRVAARIRQLVRDGATVIGPKPVGSPSLEGYPACDDEVRRIADEVWGDADGSAVTEHRFGKGRVVWGRDAEDVLRDDGTRPDVTFADPAARSVVLWEHRRTDDADIYLIANHRGAVTQTTASFRVAGRRPELWDPQTGEAKQAPAWQGRDGRTEVRLRVAPYGSVFVVFRDDAGGATDPVVEVTRDGRSILAPADPSSDLVIRRATYGLLNDPRRTVDVTEALAARVSEGAMPVGDNTLTGDPAPMVVKQILVEYDLRGEPRTVVAREGQPISFGDEHPRRPEPPVGELDVSPGGTIELTAWQPGEYALRHASGRLSKVAVDELPAAVEVGGPWRVRFPAGWGAPARIELDDLTSWTDHADPGVRYFSGTAAYETTFDGPAELLGAGRVVHLDLGDVRHLATVELNGRDLGVWWTPPFRQDVTGALVPGENRLVVRVTNLWPNRLIGDEQEPDDLRWGDVRYWTPGPPAPAVPAGRPLLEVPDWVTQGTPRPSTGRRTFTTWKFYEKDAPLLESGLLGPVRLVPGVRVAAGE